MKKMMILAAGISVMASAAQAQAKFGVEAGVNLANMHMRTPTTSGNEKMDGNLKVAAKVGGVADIHLGGKFSIQPGIFYSMKGYKSDADNNTSVGGVSINQHVQNNVTLGYIEVPVNFQYQLISPRFFVGAGPYVGVGVTGKNKYSNDVTTTGLPDVHNSDTKEVVFSNDPGTPTSGEMRIQRLDYGANLNVGYMMSCGLFFRANYALGLANLKAGGDSNNSMKNSVFTLGAGILFGGK